MAIKRYSPKYKILPRLQQPILIEQRQKLLKLKKQKWDIVKKLYFPKKPKFFSQDVSTYRLGDAFGHDRIVRKKKTYKFLLLAKQRFQRHYGEGRLKFYQLKKLAGQADKIGKNSNLPSSKVLQTFLENRLDTIFYRLGFVSSLMQAKRLLASDKIKVNNESILTLGYFLQNHDFVKFDPIKFAHLFNLYLKKNLPIFYYRKKKKRRTYLHARKNFAISSIVENRKSHYLNFFRTKLTIFSSN